MSLAPAPPIPEPDDYDDDSSTVYTAATPPESVVDDGSSDGSGSGAPRPAPGRTYMIKALSSSDVVTLRDGAVALSPPEGRGSHWACVAVDGEWLAFRNAVSGNYLGRDIGWGLCCSAGWRKEWELFSVRERREGRGGVLLMTHWWTRRPVGTRVENGTRRLAMVENWEADEMAWEFVGV